LLQRRYGPIQDWPDDFTFTGRARRRDGNYTWLETTCKVIRDPHLGQVTEIIGVSRDVTERRRTEEQLRLQASMLNTTADGILIIDRNGLILWANPALELLTGYSQEELTGQPTRLFKSGRQPASFYDSLWATVLAGRCGTVKSLTGVRMAAFIRGDEHYPVRNDQQEISHFISIKRDVSARKQAEETLLQRNRELTLLNRLSQMLSSTIHLDEVLRAILVNSNDC